LKKNCFSLKKPWSFSKKSLFTLVKEKGKQKQKQHTVIII